MKAIRQDRYGGPEVLELAEVPDPVPGPGEVLVRVRAASVNAADWHILRGDPYLARLVDRTTFGRRGPRHPIPGRDVAGTVEALGPGVTRFSVGDAVVGEVGDRGGAFAELVAVGEGLLVAKPESLSWTEAAALPLAGNTALLLAGEARVHPGSTLLVLGASGGVGTFLVQIAAARGAEVTAVCSTRNVEQARALGAAHVVDRTRDPLPDIRYDSVVDLAGGRGLGEVRRRTAPAGVLVLSGGGTSEGGSLVGPMGLMIAGGVVGLRGRPRIVIPTARAGQNIAEIVALAAAGTVRPVIERTYALADVPEAIRHMEQEHTRGKLVVTIELS